MKTTVRILAMLIASFYCDAVFAGIEDYGTATFRQPNGFTFQGRHFCDEFGDYY